MTDRPNGAWFDCLPGCAAYLPCGAGRHIVRWEAGKLRLLDHPDPEAELVLAALGGEKARCVELARAWERHAEDLSMLAIGPRGPADEIAVSWNDVDEMAQAAQPGGQGRGQGYYPPPSGGPRRRPRRPARPPSPAEQRRDDLLPLLALGYGFQVRLIGQVAEAHADRPETAIEKVRPALVAAITARLAPVAEEWLGIDPAQVEVTLHRGPGWGSVELAGRAGQRRLRVSLPAGWLARVWAAGLALTGRHLVVSVARAGWPDAQVLALRAPGTEPVPLDVHATAPGPAGGGLDVRPNAADAPHWEV